MTFIDPHYCDAVAGGMAGIFLPLDATDPGRPGLPRPMQPPFHPLTPDA